MFRNMNIKIKDITKDNYNFLREMLYEALYIPESEKPLPKSIIDKPELFKYINNWGREGDIGLIAEYKRGMIGAIWARIFSKDQKGYGFIDEKTPEISMAVKKQYRNKGIGNKLMLKILDKIKSKGYNSISLSVDKRNKAVNFYKRFGFEIFKDLETLYIMKKVI